MNNKYIEITDWNEIIKRFEYKNETYNFIEDEIILCDMGENYINRKEKYYKLNPDYVEQEEFNKGVIYMMSDDRKEWHIRIFEKYIRLCDAAVYWDKNDEPWSYCRQLTLDEAQKALPYFNISEVE